MITESDIRWGKYREFEGPFYPGHSTGKYTLPAHPSESDEVLAVITATEGGNYAAINMYDIGLLSSGLIQWIESRQYSVSAMLGQAAETDRELLSPLWAHLDSIGVEFKKNSRGLWRFFFKDGRGEVNTLELQRQLFFLSSSGRQGSWDDAAKVYAKRWAVAVASVWLTEKAKRVQDAYTQSRFDGFLLSHAKLVFGGWGAGRTPVQLAARAAYLSFAANNPTWANRHLQKFMTEHQAVPMWTRDWLIGLLRELTFGPKVAIYPHRYDKIRPVLERLYGVKLPDFSDELKTWQRETGFRQLLTVDELQRALMALGYDLGPWGADGVAGPKTRQALLQFEKDAGVPAPHQDGMLDEHTVPALERALSGTRRR